MSRRVRNWGRVFSAIGLVFEWLVFVDRSKTTLTEQALAGFAALIMIGPGVLYHISAHSVKRKESWAARLAFRTASIQCGVIVLGVLSTMTYTFLGLRSLWIYELLVATSVGIFFVPALIAQLFVLRRAMRAIQLLPTDGHAFEPIPMVRQAEPEGTVKANVIP
jgi:hypothetical protein